MDKDFLMSFSEEFKTVDLIIASDSQTKFVDAFCLSLIKSERQMRKLVTHLVYQTLLPLDRHVFINTLAEEKKVYFSGLMKGFDALSPITIEDIQGDRFRYLSQSLSESRGYRNKIFHGQLTGLSLDKHELNSKIIEIKEWCLNISTKCSEQYNFDGFDRNSLQENLFIKKEYLKLKISTIDKYKEFINECMVN